jgi:hypothetical protein
LLQPAVCIAMLACAGAACVRATKKPGAASRPGGWRSFGEYAFLEDSRYTSQPESADLDCGGFVAFVTGGETETPVSQRFPGIARSALVAPSAEW